MPAPNPHHRPDVEGLRAVAIVAVLLAHAGVGITAGGFAGVDVFFVISGFLITQVLVRELERTGALSLPRFFAGRIKRLMPQVLVAIAAVVVASPLLLSPVRADAVAGDVVAAGVYAMNWRLSESAVDYFAAGDADRPLDHFWSLAVEEQCYLAGGWPPALRELRRLARRVVVMTDPPRTPLDTPGCVSEHLRELRRCVFARGPAMARAREVGAAARVRGVMVLDATDELCLPDVCPSVIGGALVYRNSGHLTASFAATLGPWLDRRLPR